MAETEILPAVASDEEERPIESMCEYDLTDPIAETVACANGVAHVKWIAPTTVGQLYDRYVDWCGPGELKGCRSLFYQRWAVHWKNKRLRIRRIGQHATCTTCSEHSIRIKKSLGIQEKNIGPMPIESISLACDKIEIWKEF